MRPRYVIVYKYEYVGGVMVKNSDRKYIQLEITQEQRIVRIKDDILLATTFNDKRSALAGLSYVKDKLKGIFQIEAIYTFI